MSAAATEQLYRLEKVQKEPQEKEVRLVRIADSSEPDTGNKTDQNDPVTSMTIAFAAVMFFFIMLFAFWVISNSVQQKDFMKSPVLDNRAVTHVR